MKKNSRVSAQINLDAVEENMRRMKANIKKDTKMIAVVKTNAYGHGAVPIAKLLQDQDYLWGFATATVEEAMELRNAGISKPVMILGYTFAEDYNTLAEHEIRPAVFKWSMAEALSKAAVKADKELAIHIALDTGMTRIGFSDTAESLETIKKINQLPNLKIEGMFTHFARADEKEKNAALHQLKRYLDFAAALEREGVPIPLKHCSNSAGILELQQANLDAVRAGITIYGIYPSDQMNREAFLLEPVMALKSHIAFIKEVGSGVPVSYGGTYVTDHPMRIATIPVGYGDGYPRSLSNRGWVLIHGQKAPILGRVCMDQFMVDVTELQAEELDEVTLLGRDQDAEITIDMLGDLSGRFPYEFVCDISQRVPRVYQRYGKTIEK